MKPCGAPHPRCRLPGGLALRWPGSVPGGWLRFNRLPGGSASASSPALLYFRPRPPSQGCRSPGTYPWRGGHPLSPSGVARSFVPGARPTQPGCYPGRRCLPSCRTSGRWVSGSAPSISGHRPIKARATQRTPKTSNRRPNIMLIPRNPHYGPGHRFPPSSPKTSRSRG